MKRLWKHIPPYMSDVVGFEAVVNETNGAGIIDDSAHYKPVRPIREARGGHSHVHDKHRNSREGRDERHALSRGKGGGRSLSEMDMRVLHTGIRNEDVVYGTDKILNKASRRIVEELDPAFILFAHAPSSATIGSDLSFAADRLMEEGIPAAVVAIDGDRDYLSGVSQTLAAMGALLVPRDSAGDGETVPRTLNVLGCNPIDWTEEQYGSLAAMLGQAGWTVLSRWGMGERAERLREAARAEVNLVVSAAGVKLADYFDEAFGMPAVFGAPFGGRNCERIFAELERQGGGKAQAEETASGSGTGLDNEVTAAGITGRVLIVAELLFADALRTLLEDRGYRDVRVASFLEMPKRQRRPGDVKLASEDDLVREVQAASLVIGSPDCRSAAPREISWISIPDPGRFSSVCAINDFNKVGSGLDAWLDNELQGL